MTKNSWSEWVPISSCQTDEGPELLAPLALEAVEAIVRKVMVKVVKDASDTTVRWYSASALGVLRMDEEDQRDQRENVNSKRAKSEELHNLSAAFFDRCAAAMTARRQCLLFMRCDLRVKRA